MKIIPFIIFLFFSASAFGQTRFDRGKVSDSTLRCAEHINRITKNENFRAIDSLMSEYAHEKWMKMPFASNQELYELTNYPNKYVRIQAFELLLEFRDQVDTIFLILEKNTGDTLEFIEDPIGDVMYRYNIFEWLLKRADEWWQLQSNRNLLSQEQEALLKRLKLSHKNKDN